MRLIVRKTKGQFAYQSMRNTRTDFPVLACAVSCVDGVYRASIGARPSRAIVIKDDKNILADGINAESAAQFAQYVADNAPTQSNLRGSAEYRTHLAKVLTQRALEQIGGMQ